MSVNLPYIINNLTSSQLTSTGQLPASIFDQNFNALANPVNPITPVTGNLTLTAAQSGNLYLLNSPSANATITLPAPTNGATFTLVGNNSSSYTYALTTPSGNVFLGGTTASSVTIDGAVYSVIYLYSDGNNWFVLDPITMNKLTALGYATLSQISSAGYVTSSQISSAGYLTSSQLTNGSMSSTFDETNVNQTITSLPSNYDTYQGFLYNDTTATSGISFNSSDARILTICVGPNGPAIRTAGNKLDLTSTAGVLVPNATANNQAVNLGQLNGYVNSSQSSAGATLHNVTSSRAFNTTYTNSTSRLMYVMVTGNNANTGNTVSLNAVVNGTTCGLVSVTGGTEGTIVFFVPVGSTYEATESGLVLATWMEYD
jgi:hypothetical protein